VALRKIQNGGSTKRGHCATAAAAAAAEATDRCLHANRSKVSHPLLLLPPLPSSGSPCQRELRRVCSAYRQWEHCPSSVTDVALWDTTKRLRHLVSSEEANPGITQAVIDAGLVPILVRLLARDHDLPTVYEAVYALVNVTYITCAVVFQQDWAVQHLGKLVASSQSPEIREHAAWCLGNMVCESSQYRDIILEDHNARQGLYVNHPRL
jgi:Armadillo/beta-catenin-like repeat